MPSVLGLRASSELAAVRARRSGRVHEREADHVRIAHDERRGRSMSFVGERREAQRLSGRLMPLSARSFAPRGGAWVILHPKARSASFASTTPADLAVIEPDALARPHVREDLGQRAGDRRWPGSAASLRSTWSAGRPGVGSLVSDEQITGLEQQDSACTGGDSPTPRLDVRLARYRCRSRSARLPPGDLGGARSSAHDRRRLRGPRTVSRRACRACR